MLELLATEDSVDVPIQESSRKSHGRLPLGRVFGILFDAEPREIERTLTQERCRPQGLFGEASLALVQHVKEMNVSGLMSEQSCVPILEHAVKSKDPNYRKRSVALLDWLLQDRQVGMVVASSLKAIIGASQYNKRVKLGWCLLIRELIQKWSEHLDEVSPLYCKTYEILVTCIPELVHIVCLESVKEDKRRFPTRLTIAAGDCMLIITKTLATGPPAQPQACPEVNVVANQQRRPLISPLYSSTDSDRSSDRLGIDLSNIGVSHTSCSSVLFSKPERREVALWNQLDNLISFVRELEEWNCSGRPLFATGLHCVHRRLKALANYRDSFLFQEGEFDPSVGASVLAACWQHCSSLMLTKEKKSHPLPILQHWLGALQYYTQQTYSSDTNKENKHALELREYALACLALVLGKLDARHYELALEESEPELLKAMLGQLHGADDKIVDIAVAILRALLFRSTLSPSNTSSSAVKMESIVPMLLDMLDTRDVTARAVVLLVADFFAENPESIEMEQLFSRLDSVESGQRRNALDVLAELLSICTRSVDMVNSSLSQTIAKHLLKRLGDTELANRVEASALFGKLDSSFTLPTLVEFLYSPNGQIRSAASAGVIFVLKGQTNESKVIIELLDCVWKLVQSSPPDGPIDVDRVMRLIPDWANTVEDWEGLIHVVVSKMFKEPANAVIPRFLSYISIELSDRIHIVFPLVLDKLKGQPTLTKVLLTKFNEDSNESDGGALGRQLFERLSPLLVLRVLPLKAFNDHTCKELYGGSVHIAGGGSIGMDKCITSILLDRVCGANEFEDVRKVASELTGRLLPDIMIPLLTAQLKDARDNHDLARLKACIYVLCASLGIRGWECLNHPLIGQVCDLLMSILLWPWSPDVKGYSEVGKAQHGCIDCLAMMICAELQPQMDTPLVGEIFSEHSANGSQPDLVKECPTSVWAQRISPACGIHIKVVEELPVSEQLQISRCFQEHQTKLVDEIPNQDQIVREPSGGREKLKLIKELSDSEVVAQTFATGDQRMRLQLAIISTVIDCLTGQDQRLPWCTFSNTWASSKKVGESDVDDQQKTPPVDIAFRNENLPLHLRVCMANVLISTCQKVAPGARNRLAERMIPPLVTFVQVSNDSKLRASCLQVLFNAVYHLGSPAVLPYAYDLLGLSIAAIKSPSLLEERFCGAKLLASLLASEETLVRDLAPYLIDAQLALASTSAVDSSPELRVLCGKLLLCLSMPGDL